jgi:hypothetical protein
LLSGSNLQSSRVQRVDRYRSTNIIGGRGGPSLSCKQPTRASDPSESDSRVATPTPEQINVRQRREAGLAGALDRAGAMASSRSGDALIPFTEALAWLYSLHQWHKIHFPGGEGALNALADTTEEGRTHQAVVWARGLETHQDRDVAHLLSYTFAGMGGPIGMVPIGGALVVTNWFWVEGPMLPPHRADPREDLYDRLVARRPLLDPLSAAQSFITALA